jgi:PAS domain S-box-containing protein
MIYRKFLTGTLIWTILVLMSSASLGYEPGQSLVVAGDDQYAPFEFRGADGKARGIFVDFWEEWSKETGIPIEYRLSPWPGSMEMVRQGEADVVSGLFRSAEREAYFDFGAPFFTIESHIFFHDTVLGVRTLNDLKGFRVGVVQGDYAEEYLAANASFLRLALYEDYESLVRGALEGDIRVFIGDQPVISFFLARHVGGRAFRYVEKPLYAEACYPAVRKGDQSTLAVLRQHYGVVSAEQMESIVGRWAGKSAFQRLPWIWIMVGGGALLLVMLFLGLRNRDLLQRIGFAKISLTRSEERYHLAVQGSNDGIWDWDRETDQVYFSPRWKEIVGYQDDEIPNELEEWTSRIHPDDLDKVLDANQTLLDRNAESFTVEYRMRHKDGSWRWILGRGTCLRDAQGKIRRMAGVHSDVTRRRGMEEELRRSEETLREILENMMDGYYRADMQGRLIMANRRMHEMLGYASFAEVEGRDVAETFYFYPEQRQAFLSILMENGTLQAFGGTLRHRDGSPIPVETSSRLISNLKGEPVALEGVVRDVSERRRHEQELQLLIAKLEAKNDELERFTYTVSHDLKSPIITIKGFLGLLERDLQVGDKQRVADDLARINSATDRMEQLLRELLELSRIGRMDNPMVRVPLREVAQEALEMAQGQLEKSQAQVDGLESLPVILCDRPRMVQVFLNIFTNAAKFSRPDTPLKIMVETVAQHDDHVLIRIADNGRGIKQAYLETVFGLFQQLDLQEQGTGLGLALVRRIIENHGGRVWAESEGEGRGTAFVFTLPVNGGISGA